MSSLQSVSSTQSGKPGSDKHPILQALETNTDLLSQIFEQIPVGIEFYDAEGQLVKVNKKCLEIFGLESHETVLGFKLFDDPNLPADAKYQLIHGDIVKYEADFDFSKVKYETTQSGIKALSVTITQLKPEQGKVYGYVVIVEDISDRKRAMSELQARNAELEKMTRYMVNRELKMAELKQKLKQSGLPED